MSKVVLCFCIFIFSFSLGNTAPLDEVFKDIEVSGTVRYRYEVQKTKKFDKKSGKHQSKTRMEMTIN